MIKTNKKFYVPMYYSSLIHMDSINQIAKPLFTRSPIHYFDYSRIFFDGSWTFFTTQRQVSEYLFDAGFTFLPYVSIQKQHSFILLSSIPAFTPYLNYLKHFFDVDNLFAYIKKEQTFLDVYWFASKSNNHQAINFYFNHLDVLQQYTRYFHDQAADLVTIADKNRILIPSSLQCRYKQAFEKVKSINGNDISFRFDYVRFHDEQIKFTGRELDCIKFFVKGYTAKMIAAELSLSSRTVEQYLGKIKNKLRCRSREELLYFFMEERG